MRYLLLICFHFLCCVCAKSHFVSGTGYRFWKKRRDWAVSFKNLKIKSGYVRFISVNRTGTKVKKSSGIAVTLTSKAQGKSQDAG
jgi:hypothetical protein